MSSVNNERELWIMSMACGIWVLRLGPAGHATVFRFPAASGPGGRAEPSPDVSGTIWSMNGKSQPAWSL